MCLSLTRKRQRQTRQQLPIRPIALAIAQCQNWHRTTRHVFVAPYRG